MHYWRGSSQSEEFTPRREDSCCRCSHTGRVVTWAEVVQLEGKRASRKLFWAGPEVRLGEMP
jgi:hypothetical protein